MNVVSPEGTSPGSKEWMDGHVQLSKNWASYTESDVRVLMRYVRNLKQHDWKQYVKGEDDWPRFCREILGQNHQFLAEMEEGLIVLEKLGHKGPITPAQAKEAGKRHKQTVATAKANKEPLNPNGRPTENFDKKEKHQSSEPKHQGGTSAAYKVKKLRRDHPEIAEKLENGEFKTVSEAERVSKGLPAKKPRVVTSNVDKIKKLVDSLSHLELEEVLRYMQSKL